MAKVTQDLNEQNAPDYLNASRGTDKARAIANTSVGDIFKDIGNLVTPATKAAYEGINQRIRTGVEAAVDHVRGAFGVDAAVEAAAQDRPLTDTKGDASNSLFDKDPAFRSGRGTPAGVARLGNTMQSLNEAYQQGKLSETYYNARLLQIVKETKAANPGFSEEIDQHIKSITGIDPANATRKSLQNDLDQAERARQASMSKEEAFIQQNAEYLTKDTARLFIAGDRSADTLAKAKWEIYGRTSYKAEIDQQMKELELSDKKDKNYQTQATRTAGLAINAYVDQTLFKSFDGTVGAGNSILNKIQDKDSSKPWTPQELEQITTQYNQLKTQTMLGVDAQLSQPAFSGMDQSTKKGIRDAAEARLGVIESAIKDKEFGVLNRNKNFLEAMQSADGRRLMESSEWLRKEAAIGALPGGKEFSNFIAMLPDSQWMKGRVKAARDLDNLDIANGTSLPAVIENRQKLARTKAAEGSPEAYNQLITEAATGLAKAPTGGIAENYAKSLFGDQEKFWGLISAESKPRVYGILLSPDVQKKMEEVKGTQPELYAQYQKFAVDGFNNLYRSKIQTIANEGRNANSPFEITFNPQTNQFVPKVIPGREKEVFGTSGKGQMGDAGKVLDAQILEVNRALSTLAPVLKSGKQDVGEALQAIFQANGWKPGEKDPTLTQKLGDAVLKAGGKVADFFTGGEKETAFKFGGIEPGKSVKSDYTPSQGDKISINPSSTDTGTKGDAIKAVIRQAEAGKDGYNAVFGSVEKIPLTKMSLNEVMRLQDQMRASGSPSTAVGGYQFLNRTLTDLKKQLNLTGEEQFNDALQDKLADALLHKRGWGKYTSGEITHKQLIDNLAMEWAGLPNTKGKSHYDGDGLNRSTVKLRAVLDAVKKDDQS